MYAVLETGSKQYRVSAGDTIEIERLPVEAGKPVTFDRVLLIANDGKVTVGAPTVTGATVVADVVSHIRGEKKLTFKKLSELSNVPISTIKTWSAGVEPKSFAAARRVARVLGVSVEYLVFGSTDKTQISFQDVLTTQLFSGWCKVTIEMPVTTPIAKRKGDGHGD